MTRCAGVYAIEGSTSARAIVPEVVGDISTAFGASPAFATGTTSWPGTGELATGCDEDVATESSIVASSSLCEWRPLTRSRPDQRRGSAGNRFVPCETGCRSENESGEAVFPAPAVSLDPSGTWSGSAAGSGSTRSITVVSNSGVEPMEATFRTAAPVVTTSAEPTTPPMISRCRSDVLGPRRAVLSRIGLLLGENVSASCEDLTCYSRSSLITVNFRSMMTLAGIRITVNRVCPKSATPANAPRPSRAHE